MRIALTSLAVLALAGGCNDGLGSSLSRHASAHSQAAPLPHSGQTPGAVGSKDTPKPAASKDAPPGSGSSR